MRKIELYGVGKKYGEKDVLKEINLVLQEGIVYGLVGDNGAGKTTLMKIIAGIIEKDCGIVDNKDCKVSGLIDNPCAYEHLNALENLKLIMTYNDCEDDEYCVEMLGKVGLQQEKTKYKNFSLGMKKRLSIAMAFLSNPDLLILDEPTSGLDIHGISEFREMVKSFVNKKNKIVLISSHDTRDISVLCDRIIFLKKGEIIEVIDCDSLSPIDIENKYLAIG